jgi:N-acetylglutamate synthase-like GNAT family acetyltransferase
VANASDPKLAFRTAEIDDVPAVVALVESAYRGESSRRGWTTEADLIDGQRTDPEAVLSMIAKPESVVILATRNEQLCGCCHVERCSEQRAMFGMFAVSPQLQGAGVGRSLIGEACRQAASWGCEQLEMMVIKQRGDLIAWYQRLGFHPTGETQPFPYGDLRFGQPRRADLEFLVLVGSCV